MRLGLAHHLRKWCGETPKTGSALGCGLFGVSDRQDRQRSQVPNANTPSQVTSVDVTRAPAHQPEAQCMGERGLTNSRL
jgi:hypothetical protein